MIEKIAIKASIEFCLQTGDHDFLFDKIYSIFADNDLENPFHQTLSTLLMAGKLPDVAIPESILRKIIYGFEQKTKHEKLERLILNIDVANYSKDSEEGSGENEEAKSVRTYLEQVCKNHFMVSGILQLQTSDQSKDANPGCSAILDMLFE